MSDRNIDLKMKTEGEGNSPIGYLENQLNFYNFADITRTTLPLGFKQSHDYYFILSCDFNDDNLFLLRKDSVNIFTDDFTEAESRDYFVNNKEEIYRTPTLVSKLGDPDHLYYGFIRGYKKEDKICSLKFFLICELPREEILEHAKELNIWKKDLKNELTYNSWSIKRGNVNQKLKKIGIHLPEF